MPKKECLAQLILRFMRYICDMKPLLRILLVALLLLAIATPAEAQSRKQRVRGASAARWEVDSRGDSVLHITLLPVNIFHRTRDLKNYQKMVRAVKKVYPLALEASRRMASVDVQLSDLKRRDRKRYTEAMEEALKEEITPMLWKMTRYEGKILLKLIDRETDFTVYQIIKDYRSGFTAGFYQMLARMFGNNLKLQYDPKGEDEMLEQIVLYYKAGLL